MFTPTMLCVVLVSTITFIPTVVVKNSAKHNKLMQTGRFYEQFEGTSDVCLDEKNEILATLANSYALDS